MTVAELIAALERCEPTAPVAALSLHESGAVIDIDTSPVLTVHTALDDNGSTAMVWVTAAGDSPTPAPELISWPCPCGDVITVTHRSSWPADHDGH